MKQVIFYTQKNGQETEVGRVWNDKGALTGTVNEMFLADLIDWFSRSGESIEQYLENLHARFDGTFLYAGPYQEQR